MSEDVVINPRPVELKDLLFYSGVGGVAASAAAFNLNLTDELNTFKRMGPGLIPVIVAIGNEVVEPNPDNIHFRLRSNFTPLSPYHNIRSLLGSIQAPMNIPQVILPQLTCVDVVVDNDDTANTYTCTFRVRIELYDPSTFQNRLFA